MKGVASERRGGILTWPVSGMGKWAGGIGRGDTPLEVDGS